MRWLSRSVAALALAGMVAVSPAFAADSEAGSVASAVVDEPDLSTVRLDLDDLPEGFREVPDSDLAEAGISSRQIGESLGDAFEAASLEHYLVYSSADETDVFEVMLVGPLTHDEVSDMTSDLEKRRDDVAEALTPSFALFVDFGEATIIDTADIGEASIGITYSVTVSSDLAIATNVVGREFREAVSRFLVGIRGNQMFIVGGMHAGTEAPDVDVRTVARLIDQRLADALGVAISGAGEFRPAGTYSPEVATHIPTLTQVSTEPRVIGANLLLAAIAVVVMGAAMRLLNSTLARHEGALEQLLAPARAVGRWWRSADDVIRRRAGGTGNWIRVGGVLLFYGILFSFLEPGWNPFSVAGLVVLVVMTIAFGLVGTGDDLSELASAHRRGLMARLVVKPALVMMAVGSVLLTKVAGLVPGLMIGTPESFSMEGDFDEREEVRLAAVGMGTTALIGLGAWTLSAPLGGMLGDDGGGLLAAVVALLVLVYAVAVENLFANLLGFPGSEGEALRRRNPIGWGALILVVTGLFFHTLINPSGEFGESLETTNVRVVLGTVAAFSLATVGVWLVFRGRPESAEPAPLPAAHTDVVTVAETPSAVEADAEPALLPPPRTEDLELAASPEGWYVDPVHHHEGRYWDGAKWTAWVADHGTMDTEPIGADAAQPGPRR